MIDVLQKGGPIMWLLIFCSVFVFAILIERWFTFHKSTLDVGKFIKGLGTIIRRGNFDEALHECSGRPVPVTRVIYAIISRHDAPREELRQIAQEAGQLEVPLLERRLTALSTMAYVSPLIGLLGTVVGLLQIFVELSSEKGYLTSAEMSGGIYQSLLTSAAGLAIAVVSFAGYGYFSAWLNTLMHDMERAGIEVLHMLDDRNREKQQSDKSR